MNDKQIQSKSIIEQLTESSQLYESQQGNAQPDLPGLDSLPRVNIPIEHQSLEAAPEEPIEQEMDMAPEEIEPEPAPVDAKQAKIQENWRSLREKASRVDQLQKERDEARYYAQAMEKESLRYQQQQRIPQEAEEPDYDLNSLSDDEIVDVRTLKKIQLQEINKQKALEKKQNESRAQQESYRRSVNAQMRETYADFNDVLSNDNIAKLEAKRPGLARSLAQNPDFAEVVLETYHIIKDLGIYRSPLEVNNRAVIQKNMAKPRSANTVAPQSGDTPLNKAGQFTGGAMNEEQRRALWADMQKNRGGW